MSRLAPGQSQWCPANSLKGFHCKESHIRINSHFHDGLLVDLFWPWPPLQVRLRYCARGPWMWAGLADHMISGNLQDQKDTL